MSSVRTSRTLLVEAGILLLRDTLLVADLYILYFGSGWTLLQYFCASEKADVSLIVA